MVARLLKLEGEVLSALCSKCTCCLADGTHCWNCHVAKPIEKLCGCGTCKVKADDYIERVHRTQFNRLAKKVIV